MKQFALRSTRCFSTLAALTLSLTVHAEIYKSVDEHGNVTYSDKAGGGQTEVELKPSNSVPAVVAPAPSSKAVEEEGEAPVRYSRLKIVSPANDSGIEHGPGNFSVETSLKPALAANHTMQLFIDGKPHKKPAKNTSFGLTNVYRGTHKLQVKIFDANGKVIKSSKSSTVHVFRPSVLLPGSRR